MTLKIYNTLSRKKEVFQPVTEGKVNMYVCGPTVYNYIHIGNARPFIFFDVVRRYLIQQGYDVTYVVNFTDVDDKLIRKAEETGSSVAEVADRFIRAYYEDAKMLGIRAADIHPRATEHVPEFIDFIRGLMDKGYAYAKDGDVFFRTKRFAAYGALSHQNLEELHYGIRVEVDERKEDARDFVLWKKAKPGEIHWPSPWGDGRPGWHIECSAMAIKYLGATLDIHGGGSDLAFPHHECELAQSEALSGQPFVKYWMHNGYINIDNEKMSKSLGNVVNVHEMLKTIPPETIRYFVLSAHYRNPLNFGEDAIRQAEGALERMENCLSNLKHRLNAGPDGQASEEEDAFLGKLERIRADFHMKMQDDFNTPDAITAMFELVAEINLLLRKPSLPAEPLHAALALFREMDGIMGILKNEDEALLDEEVERLIEERAEARKAKQWARADEIRDLLIKRGIQLEDTPQGMRWRRK